MINQARDVRAIAGADIFPGVALMRDFHFAFNGGADFDAPYCSQSLARLIADGDSLALGLFAGDALRGLLLATVGISPLSPALVSREIMFWVAPSARGRGAVLMVPAYETWARDKGCAAVGLAELGDPAIARLYRRMGYAPFENHYLKRV